MWIFRLSADPAASGRPDFVAPASGVGCLFSERAVACLRELLARDGEFLPVACASGTFSVYNCRRRLTEAARPEAAHAFRILTRGAQLFVSGTVAERILACGLNGYLLEPLWVEWGGLQVGCAPGDVARLAWESGIGYLQPFVAEHLAPAFRLRPSSVSVDTLDHKCGGGIPLLVHVNLADVNAPPLPAAGLLSFFGDGDRWAVHYAEAGAPPPSGWMLEVSPMLTLPPPDAPSVQALHLDSEDQERYRTLVDAVAKSYGPGHQLLGHPAVSCDLPPLPGGWTLLLQLDRRICFWAPTSDLAERRFDRVQVKRG
jgi:hypothetical protein